MRRALGATLVILLAAGGCTGRTETAPPGPPPPGPTPQVGALVPLPPLAMPRASHTATRLPDGRVLVVGGCTAPGCGGTPDGGQTDVYDPATRTFTPGATLRQARVGHTATALADGRVLIAGGWPDEGRPALATAEIYDPRSGQFEAAGPMTDARGGHTASRLPDGRVLVVGGESGRVLAGVEIFDPATGRFRAGPPLPAPRAAHAAATLDDGTVLVVGGTDRTTLTDSALRYDPRTNAWEPVGALQEAKYKLAVAPLPGGGALVVGGQTSDARIARLRATEVYDPGTRSFRAGPELSEPRFKLSEAVVALPDGRVVIGGGGSTVEIFANGQLTVLDGRLGGERQFPTATVLADGTVLITGGYDNSTNVTAEAFLADPG